MNNQKKQGRRFGTNNYSSIEVLLKGEPSYSADIWSVGIVFLQILVGRHFIFNNFLHIRNLNPQSEFLCSYLM